MRLRLRRGWASISWEERLLSPLGATLFVASASALCAVVISERAWLPFYGSIAVLVVGVAWPFAAVYGLRAELSFARPRVRECEPIEGTLKIRNRNLWGVVHTSVQDGGATLGDATGVVPGLAVIEYVPALRLIRGNVRLPAATRGLYPQQLPQLTNGFPFGLVTARRWIGVPRRVIVWPRSYPLCVPTRLLYGGADGHEHLVDRSGNQGETIGVRQFHQGDSPKRIHWPQTARQGRTVVREQQRRISARILLSLDIANAKPGVASHRESREWAIRVASSIFESWSAVGTHVELCLGEGAARYSSKTEKSRTQALDALATFDELPATADHSHRSKQQTSPSQYDLHVVLRISTTLSGLVSTYGGCRTQWNILVTPPELNGLIASQRDPPGHRRPSGRAQSTVLAADDSLPLVLAGICRELADGKS